MPKLYLKEYGHKVLDNGYEVVPITPGTKFPNFETWKSMPEITHTDIDKWQSNGHAKDGIGIRAKFTPLLDVDVKDDDAREAMVKFAEDTIGLTGVRIGEAPKLGLPYKSDEPFKKVQSRPYMDPEGRKAQIEFLGDGQQWVALARHPDTKKPYKWPDKGMNPVKWPREDLPTVSKEQAIACRDFFDEYCTSRGWKLWKKKTGSNAVAVQTAPPQGDDVWDGRNTAQCGLAVEQVKEWVDRLPNDESVEYEDNFNSKAQATYRNVLFAIWHETDGSEEGRDIAWDWSIKSPKHETEEGRFFKLWSSANPEDREDVITFRYVINCVNDIEREEKRELRDGFLDSLSDVDDVDDLKKLIERMQTVKFDDLDSGQLAGALQKAYKRVTGSQLSPAQARKMIRHIPTADEIPEWAQNWVYIQHADRFYNTDAHHSLTQKAFDNTYTRYLDGYPASQYALNILKIKPYWMTMYKPDAETEFYFEGHQCINTFNDRLMPIMPDSYDDRDLECIKLFRTHVRNILPNKRERALLISFMAYIVQTHARPNFALVLQGTDGDGKSFFGDLMGACLGGTRNVRKLDPQQLQDRYTGWAVGQLLIVIEEIRLQGQSRFEILNKVKPFITNEAINIHPKGIDPYTAFNTSAYMASTNFKDALPVNDNDRRYLIFMSRFQTGEAIREFEAANPGYFTDLFGTIRGDDPRPGALRKYLMRYELHPDFQPHGRAPKTRAREEMVQHGKTDIQLAFEELVENDSIAEISTHLIISSVLIKELRESTTEHVSARSITALLSQNGFVYLSHRVRITSDQKNMDTVWVRDKKRFDNREASRIKRNVMKYLKEREEQITHSVDI